MTLTRAAAFLAFLTASAAAGAAWAATTQTTNTLNLRSGPGVHYGVVVVIPKGSSIDVSKCGGTDWCDVTWGRYKGYADGRYLASHVTVAVPSMGLPKPGSVDPNKADATARIGECRAQWGMADLNGDGVLEPEEVAHYNSSISATGQAVLHASDRFDQASFVAKCAAGTARE